MRFVVLKGSSVHMTKKKLIQEFLLMTFGTALVAIGTYVFKFPNNFSTGGVTGMAVILSSVFPAISSSTYAAVINLLFLVLGFAVLNRGFGLRTVYCFSAVLRDAVPDGMAVSYDLSPDR